MPVPAPSWIPSVPLEPPPPSIVAPNGSAHVGTFAGPLDTVRFDGLRDSLLQSRVWRTAHHKRWLYAFVAAKHHLIAVAIVHLGYLGNAFVIVVDRRTRSSLFDGSFLTLPSLLHVSDTCESGCDCFFRSATARIAITRPAGSPEYTLAADARGVSLRASFTTEHAAIPIVAVSPVPNGVLNVTEKRVLMPARGALLIDGNPESLEDATAGLDYTNGFLARHTAWRWAFAMGSTTDGRPIAFNLVDGFNEGRECAFWLDGRLVPTEGARFEFQHKQPLSPWRVTTNDRRIDLAFAPDTLHAEHNDFGIVRSRFIQPFGVFRGTIRAPNETQVSLDGVPGVVESQDVLW